MCGQLAESKEFDLQFSLEDLETIKVIGKGSGVVVQLVRHKWVGTLFALKVSIQLQFPATLLSLSTLIVSVDHFSKCTTLVMFLRTCAINE